MRILMTTDTVGGVWTFTQELVSGLLEHGCHVALFALGGPPSEEQIAWRLGMNESCRDNFCFRSSDTPLEWMQENDRAFSEAVPSLLRLVKEFEPEVLHSNQFCFGALPVPVAKIVTAHSDVLSWAANCLEVPLEDSRWLEQYHSLISTGLTQADAVVAPTQWMLDALGHNFTLPDKQFVFPNGRKIDPRPQRERKMQSVTAGRLWDKAKNVAILADVRSPMPMLIAGKTSCQQTSLPTIAQAAEFLGALSQKALLTVFSESAIYICASQYEPFGLAPLEAALCGCAVLANDISSLREVWGQGALYFNDADSLSQLLHALYADHELLAQAQALSLERAQRYTREAMTSAYLSSFQNLAAGKREQ